MHSVEKSPRLLIFILIITIIIDIMGVGLVMPILPALFYGDAVTFHAASAHHIVILYSLALIGWPLGLAIGGPVVGELSDKYGRKRTLLFALSMVVLSYVLSVIAIEAHFFILFFLSRLLSGIFGGAFEVAQATVVDVSPKKDMGRNLGYITMAASFGIMVGPIITSMTTAHWFDWMTTVTPFIVAGILSALNVLSLWCLMPKDVPKHRELKITSKSISKTIVFLFADKRVRYFGLIYLLLQVAWGFYAQGVPLFLRHYYDYHTASIGLFYSWIGFAVVFCSLLIQPKILEKVHGLTVYLWGGLICGIFLISVCIVHWIAYQWTAAFIVAAVELMCYTALLTVLSGKVSDQEQGKVMGSAGAAFGLAWAINDVFMVPMNLYSVALPILVGGLLFFVTVGMVYRMR